MRLLQPIVILIALSGCTDHPDQTTVAIDEAARTGGVCTQQTGPVFDAAGHAEQTFDCADRALRDISALVFNDQE
jgi:hypothetical protein